MIKSRKAKSMHIYVPSLNRPEWIIKHGTLSKLPEYLWPQISIVVNTKQQAKEYRQYVPKRIDIVVSNVSRIAPTRMFIGKFAYDKGEKIVAMFDDDLKFYKRYQKDDMWRLQIMESDTYATMLEEMEKYLKKYNIVGISARQGNNRQPLNYKRNQRIVRAWAIRTKDLIEVNINDTVMDDFDLMLQLLEQGKPNLCIYKYAQDQRGHHAVTGGTATYRTLDSQEEAAKILKDRHPQFVDLVKRKYTSGGFKERLEVLIHWEKAYKYGKDKDSRLI
jgi:TET-Associated Glycosyltransferase